MKTFLQTLFFFFLVTQICSAQWTSIGLNDESIKDIAARNSLIFAITADSGKLYRSTDDGSNWTTIFEMGVIDINISPSGDVFMVKDSIYNSGPLQLFRSSDAGSNWLYLNVIEQLADSHITGGPYSVKISPMGTIFCTISWVMPRWTWGTGIAMTTDNGVSWASHFLGGMLYDFNGNSIITVGDIIESQGSSGRLISLSEDGGFLWTEWLWGNGNYIPAGAITLCSNGNILAGVVYPISGIILSEDTCGSWVQVSTIVPDAGLSIATGGWLVGNDSLGVFLFSENGDSLGSFNEGLSNLNVHTLAIDNNDYVYAGTDNGLWRRPLSEVVPVELTTFTATANGKEVTLNWSTATELNNQGFEVQRKFGSNDFVTVGSVKGYGTTTSQNNYTYTDKLIDAGKYFYRLKQMDFGGKYKYSQIVEINWSPFTNYMLEQNYPNPFNPTTTIGFGIPEKGNVRLSVLNILGEEIKVLLNEEKEAGYHSVEFNASDLPSSVYFYRIQSGNFIETKKMILLR